MGSIYKYIPTMSVIEFRQICRDLHHESIVVRFIMDKITILTLNIEEHKITADFIKSKRLQKTLSTKEPKKIKRGFANVPQ